LFRGWADKNFLESFAASAAAAAAAAFFFLNQSLEDKIQEIEPLIK
jgi:type VI protein secretion system component VasF